MLVACGAESEPVDPPRDAGVVVRDGGVETRDGGTAIRDGGVVRDSGVERDAGPPPEYPPTLAETGFDDPRVRAYTPAYPLWSDGAAKQRWILLPEGTTIDTSDPDRWRFPVGTKFWKSFERDGVRVETRLIEKLREPNDWVMVAYAWNQAQTEAVAVPEGMMDHLGTDHDVPTTRDCGSCHLGVEDRVLGFGAVQLGSELATLEAEGLLSDPIAPFAIPGNDLERDVLTYFHANCGPCHNRDAIASRPDYTPIDMWLELDEIATVEGTPAYRTTVGVRTRSPPIPGVDAPNVIEPQDPDRSMLYVRMNRRGFGFDGMPPWFASELVDEAATSSVATFIRGL